MSDVLKYPTPRTEALKCPAAYHAQREEQPFGKVQLYDGTEAWMVTKVHEAKAFLDDPAMSTDKLDPRYPSTRKNLTFVPDAKAERPITSLDGEEHLKYRRMLSPEFTAKRVGLMRGEVQRVVDEALDEFIAEGNPGDIVRGVCQPVASRVISIMLGVPAEDHEYFEGRSARLLKRVPDPDDYREAQTELRDYIASLVKAKSERPDDKIISRLLKKVDSGEMRESQLRNFAFVMLLAGHETTANTMALSILYFLQNPDRKQEMLDNPELMPAVVEEMLRFTSILDEVTSRFATRDVVIAGHEIKAGEAVCISGIASNHDPEVYPSPEEVDFHRDAEPHVAFGYGPHQCLGQTLARTELACVFRSVFERLPGLELAVPAEDLPFKSDGVSYGLYELPVRW